MVSTLRTFLCPQASLAVQIACLILGIRGNDGLSIFVAASYVAVSAVLLVQCRKYRVPDVPLVIQAAATIAGTVLMVHVFGWSEGCGISLRMYSHIEGIVFWVMTYSVACLVLMAIANAFDARFNRILIGGFTMFLSIGICTLQWVFVSLFFKQDLDIVYFSSQEMAYLFVNLVLSVVAFLCIARALKGKHRYVERREAGQ